MSQLAPGRVLADRYRLDDRIARGGMATVWLGRDDLLGRRVAVKTLHPELAHDDAVRGRFRQEAVAAAALTHPNIVATYDTGEDDGTAFIVMELVDGESLRQLLDRTRVLDPPEPPGIPHPAALGPAPPPPPGVVHRDIKPANVLVGSGGVVKVTDFGIAKATGGADFTRTGTVVGTARYLSPEQVQGLPTDARTDVYSLGLVLYEMLAGRPAFSGDTEMATALARLTGPPPPLELTRPGIPPALARVVETALQPDPAHRIPSAAAFDEALLRVAQGGAPPRTTASAPLAVPTTTTGAAATTGARPSASSAPSAPSTPRPTPRSTPGKKRRHPFRVLLFLLFLVALGVAAGLITAKLVSDGGGSGSRSGAAPSIAFVSDFDPFGNNGSENPQLVGLAVDGDEATAWSSETYVSRDVGGKPGVGLVVTLDRTAEVSSVRIDGAGGADVEIYVADSAGSTLASWGPVRASAGDIGDRATVTVDPTVAGNAVLVWFTRTPESGRIDVSELRVS